MKSTSATAAYNQQPVNDFECEQLVIGTLIQNAHVLDDCSDLLSDDCFYDGRLKMIFHAINEMVQKASPVDIVTLPPYLEKTATDYHFTITEILNLSAKMILSSFREKCEYLYELSQRRKLLTMGMKLVNAGTTQNQELETILSELNESIDTIDVTPVSSITNASDAFEQLEKNVMENQKEDHRVFDRSGFTCFDERAFLRPQALTVIAANSGHGKSCLATSIAYNCAISGSGIAYYSLEMSKEELIARTAAPLCKIETSKLLYGKISKDELRRFQLSALEIKGIPLYFDERATISTDALFLSIRQMVRQKHIKGVIIDYLQILYQKGKPKNITEEAFLGGTIRSLKNMAKQLNIWIIVLSQLSRNHDSEEPNETYLRGSGQILEGCDNCALLYRPEKTDGMHYGGINANVSPTGTAHLN